ncbi:MAG: Uma2 family endonuclease [Gemmataceae bacterium]|nr:Uma2 family endonuclease [Gemmataceae bacterium]
MPVLIYDPVTEKDFRADRKRLGLDRWDEFWDGVLVVPPMPNTEHFRIASRLNTAFSAVVDWDRGDQAVGGGNVSDRVEGWDKNYRCPDGIVSLAGGFARDCGTHWCGGPDFLVEIISPGEDPQLKFDFYAKVKVRELLVVDRDPWAVELYQLRRGKLRLAGRSDLTDPKVLASGVLPLSFQLRPGKPRPKVLVTHAATGQTWTA